MAQNNILSWACLYASDSRSLHQEFTNFPDPAVPPVVTGYAMNNPRPMAGMENGVAVKSVEDVRWLRCDIKSLNLLGNVLAKQEAYEAGCIEALLHRDGDCHRRFCFEYVWGKRWNSLYSSCNKSNFEWNYTSSCTWTM